MNEATREGGKSQVPGAQVAPKVARHSPLFQGWSEVAAYAGACTAFATDSLMPVPVYVGQRKDLVVSMDLASQLYTKVVAPVPADLAILFSEEARIEVALPLIRRLVSRVVRLADLTSDMLAVSSQRVLLCGLYDDLTNQRIGPLLWRWFDNPQIEVVLLTGRDLASLTWMIAKQFAQADWAATGPVGIFTYHSLRRSELINDQDNARHIQLYDAEALERCQIQEAVFGQAWQTLLFHGHGKDDNLNLADYTVCGFNPDVARNLTMLAPRCAYDGQCCFKDQAKLIPLNKVVAEQIILNSCNSAPLADAGSYDPKYILALNAIDGVARRVTAALTVQDAGTVDIQRWLQCDYTRYSSARIFTTLMRDITIYPAFLEFGVPQSAHSDEFAVPSGAPEPSAYEIAISRRVTRYLMGSFLSPQHKLRLRIEKLSATMNSNLDREVRGLAKTTLEKQLRSHIASLDYALAQTILQNSDDELLNFEPYADRRVKIDPSSIQHVRCQCGNEAIRYRLTALTETVFSLERIVCVKCDHTLSCMEHGPDLQVHAHKNIRAGTTLSLACKVTAREDGRVLLGWFVPVYLREYVASTPQLLKKKLHRGDGYEWTVEVPFSSETPAQGYSLTVFAVQNLAISLWQQNYGVEQPL